jgi:hypothetical protein
MRKIEKTMKRVTTPMLSPYGSPWLIAHKRLREGPSRLKRRRLNGKPRAVKSEPESEGTKDEDKMGFRGK